MKQETSKRKDAFFNASVLLEELSENEMFKLKGGYSDTEGSDGTEDDPVELGEVVIESPGGGDDGGGEGDDGGGGDEDWGDGWDDDEWGDDEWEDPDYWDNDGGGESDNPDTTSEDTPFQRDANGNIITTPTGNYAEVDYTALGGCKVKFEEVIIKTQNGIEIIAYRAIEAYAPSGQQVNVSEQFKSNCTGFAFAEGDLWLFDPSNTGNQLQAFENLLNSNTLYLTTTPEDANYVVIWQTDSDTGERYIAHSGIVNEDGTIDNKGEYFPIERGESLEDFKDGYDDPSRNPEIVYYKRNF